MARKYFGTDGIRGLVGEAPITPDFVMRLGYAAGKVLAKGSTGASGRPNVLIGKDTRISGYMLEAALEAGFSAAGVDVMLAGPMPTPAIAYLVRALRLQAGVVISASHNPFQDNGIKFFSEHGTKLPDAVELEIEEAIDQPMGCVSSEKLGRATRLRDAQGRYIEFCKSTFPNELDLRGLKIVVDCAHGAAYAIAPHVFHELGAEVIELGTKPDGFNINDGVGATAPKAMAQAVVELLYVMVRARMATGKVEGAVGTLMTNMALEVAFKEMGVGFARAKVGDRYVLEVMQERGWLYGGEGSGHLLALDKHTTGDGIVSALQVLQAVSRSGRTLAELLEGVTLFPQTLLNVRLAEGVDWKTSAPLAREREAVERELGDS